MSEIVTVRDLAMVTSDIQYAQRQGARQLASNLIEIGRLLVEAKTMVEPKSWDKYIYHDKVLCKCKVYGLTHSEATDWAGRWMACGAFNRAISRKPLVREVVPERKRKEADNTPIDGQISLEELT